MRAAAWRLMKENEVCGAVQKGDFMVGSLAAAAKATSVDTSALKANSSFLSSIFIYVWAHYAAEPLLVTFVGRFSGCNQLFCTFIAILGNVVHACTSGLHHTADKFSTQWAMLVDVPERGSSDIKAGTTGTGQCLSRDHCEAMRSLFLVRMRA